MFLQVGGPFVGVLFMSALLFGVLWKLPRVSLNSGRPPQRPRRDGTELAREDARRLSKVDKPLAGYNGTTR